MLTQSNHRPRAGYTLIELLVAIGLGILLAAMTVGVANSNMAESYKIVGGADRVSGWLIIAKSKAQREGAPRGVRFILTGNTITEAQFIEVPDPFIPQTTNVADSPRLLITQVGTGLGRTMQFQALGAGVASAVQSNVSVGDRLSLPEFGLLLRITALDAVGNISVDQSNKALIPDFANATTYATTTFGFIRGARPMLGEPVLQLTGGIVIDVETNNFSTETPGGSTPPPTSLIPQTAGEFDVLFAPNGEVLNTGALPRVVFWLRNTAYTLPTPPSGSNSSIRANMTAAGEMALVVIYSKTGAISTQPVMMPPNFTDPYSAAKDGVNSGL